VRVCGAEGGGRLVRRRAVSCLGRDSKWTSSYRQQGKHILIQVACAVAYGAVMLDIRRARDGRARIEQINFRVA
jgi:hypothetical protein